jgi:hypothetical protein
MKPFIKLHEDRMPLSILVVAALLLITFAVRDARMARDSLNLDCLLFIFAIHTIAYRWSSATPAIPAKLLDVPCSCLNASLIAHRFKDRQGLFVECQCSLSVAQV